MEKIKKELEELKDSLNTLVNSQYKEYFTRITSILENMNEKIEELTVNQESLDENIRFMDSDLSNIQEELFEEVSIDELNDIEDQYTEINCIHCNNPIFIEQSALENNSEIPCPYCNKNIK